MLESLQRAVRAAATGSDPMRAIGEALRAATAASGATGAVALAAEQSDRPTIVAMAGHPDPATITVGETAIATGRLSRRRFEGTVAAALPVRLRGTIVGALAVHGPAGAVSSTPLPPFADVIALLLAQVSTGSTRTPISRSQVLEAVADVAGQPGRAGVLVRTLTGLERVFGATASCCVTVDGARMTVAHVRNLDGDRLRAAAATPAFSSALRAPGIHDIAPGDPALEPLGRPDDAAVVVPLATGGAEVGRLLVFTPAPLDPASRGLLITFATHVALALRAVSSGARIADEQARVFAAVQASPLATLVVDGGGRLLAANAAAGELLHLATPFEMGQPAVGRVGSEEIDRLLRTGADGSVEVVCGEPARPHRVTSRRMRARDHRVLGQVVVFEDLTRQRDADRMKAEFVAAVGRELRSPMMVVQGWANALRRRWATLDDSRRVTALDAIERNADHLVHLIEDLLFVFSVGDADATREVGPEDIGDLLDRWQGGRVTVSRPATPLVVALDRTSFEHVLHHLVTHALSSSDGSVVLAAAEREGQIEISVTDSGAMTSEVFDGAEPAADDDPSAVGLYLSRRLVELMGGRMWCDSRAGSGTRLAFSLPAQTPSSEHVARA